MEIDQETLKLTTVLGILLAVFFTTGFLAGNYMNPGDTRAEDVDDGSQVDVSQEEAVSKAEEYLNAVPFSYPFTYDVQTESVDTHEIGGASFYNLTVSYTVEANPFQSPIYSVPGNQTEAEKTLNVYVSPDGKYLFQSPPVRIEVPEGSQRRPAP